MQKKTFHKSVIWFLFSTFISILLLILWGEHIFLFFSGKNIKICVNVKQLSGYNGGDTVYLWLFNSRDAILHPIEENKFKVTAGKLFPVPQQSCFYVKKATYFLRIFRDSSGPDNMPDGLPTIGKETQSEAIPIQADHDASVNITLKHTFIPGGNQPQDFRIYTVNKPTHIKQYPATWVCDGFFLNIAVKAPLSHDQFTSPQILLPDSRVITMTPAENCYQENQPSSQVRYSFRVRDPASSFEGDYFLFYSDILHDFIHIEKKSFTKITRLSTEGNFELGPIVTEANSILKWKAVKDASQYTVSFQGLDTNLKYSQTNEKTVTDNFLDIAPLKLQNQSTYSAQVIASNKDQTAFSFLHPHFFIIDQNKQTSKLYKIHIHNLSGKNILLEISYSKKSDFNPQHFLSGAEHDTLLIPALHIHSSLPAPVLSAITWPDDSREQNNRREVKLQQDSQTEIDVFWGPPVHASYDSKTAVIQWENYPLVNKLDPKINYAYFLFIGSADKSRLMIYKIAADIFHADLHNLQDFQLVFPEEYKPFLANFKIQGSLIWTIELRACRQKESECKWFQNMKVSQSKEEKILLENK